MPLPPYLPLVQAATNWRPEPQNRDYAGATFQADHASYRYRHAKKTPTKAGYFVVFWEKNTNNKNQPYPADSAPDFLLISVQDGAHCGQFLFPKSALVTHGILSTASTSGKMAIRVYPTWVQDLNPTATRTQKWQCPFFTDLSDSLV